MQQQQIVIPESFYCPILQELMVDPVIDKEGNTFERAAIEEWLQKNNTSPITRNKMSVQDLFPNRAMRDSIEQLKAQIPAEQLQQLQKQNNPKQKVLQLNSKQKEKEEEKEPSKVVVDQEVKLKVTRNQDLVQVSIIPPDSISRNPLDIVCVIDISGSMDDVAAIKNKQGKQESYGLNILDIVKHAVKTIICNLQPQDRLAIVAYDDQAEVVLKMTQMDQLGQEAAQAQLEKLHPRGSTNLWDGLHSGLELIRENMLSRSNAVQTIFLLTDGQPNVIPPRGHIPMLKMYIDKNPLDCTVNTFGFGYNLDSQLLEQIALETDGMYCFIPDSQFVGTVFVNTLANIMTTIARKTFLCLEPLNGAKFKENAVLGDHITKQASWGLEIQLGSLCLGQSRDIVFQMELPQQINEDVFLGVTLKYQNICLAKSLELLQQVKEAKQEDQVVVHGLRLQLVQNINECVKIMRASGGQLTECQQIIKKFVNEFKKIAFPQNKLYVDILQDLEGQITEAFSKDEYYYKWGKHYIPSILRAHQIQACNNFKDPGVQNYGGTLFKKIRDQADETFCKLPPPKPSKQYYDDYQGGGGGGGIINMSSFNDSNGPCFDGKCMIMLADGNQKLIQDIEKNENVMVDMSSRTTACVKCVVKTVCKTGKAQLVELQEGLLLTPWHPVFKNDAWRFPADLAETRERQCTAVYSFVLDQGHTVIINGVKCASMGHGFKGQVIEHAYFGTNRIINDLSKMKGWNEGLVQLNSGCLVRDQKTGLVIGLQQD